MCVRLFDFVVVVVLLGDWSIYLQIFKPVAKYIKLSAKDFVDNRKTVIIFFIYIKYTCYDIGF